MMNDEQPIEGVVAQLPAGETGGGELDEAGAAGAGGPVTVMTEKLDALISAVGEIDKQLRYLPGQVRGLGTKIEAVGTAAADPRYRALLLSILGLYDLTDQTVRAQDRDAAADLRRRHDVLRTQIRQILESNGIEAIPADGPFNPDVHCAIERVPVADPCGANRIASVVRQGFRAATGVLRYAEVRVTVHDPSLSVARKGPTADPGEDATREPCETAES